MAPAQYPQHAIAALSAVAACERPPRQQTESDVPRVPGQPPRLPPEQGPGTAETTRVTQPSLVAVLYTCVRRLAPHSLLRPQARRPYTAFGHV